MSAYDSTHSTRKKKPSQARISPRLIGLTGIVGTTLIGMLAIAPAAHADSISLDQISITNEVRACVADPTADPSTVTATFSQHFTQDATIKVQLVNGNTDATNPVTSSWTFTTGQGSVPAGGDPRPFSHTFTLDADGSPEPPVDARNGWYVWEYDSAISQFVQLGIYGDNLTDCTPKLHVTSATLSSDKTELTIALGGSNFGTGYKYNLAAAGNDGVSYTTDAATTKHKASQEFTATADGTFAGTAVIDAATTPSANGPSAVQLSGNADPASLDEGESDQTDLLPTPFVRVTARVHRTHVHTPARPVALAHDRLRPQLVSVRRHWREGTDPAVAGYTQPATRWTTGRARRVQ